MKYFLASFITAALVFVGATIYYKGLPDFISPKGVSVISNEVMPSPTSTPKVSTSSGVLEEDLTAVIKAALIKKYGPNASDINVTVSKTEGEYAKGMATEQGGGGMWIAARLNGSWTLVWDGNGIIYCTDISPFPEFPKDMVPECWDTTTNKLITR